MVPNLRQAIRDLNPDILCLQEVQGQHREKFFKKRPFVPDLPDHEYLARKQWEHTAYGQNATHQDGHHGNAILSKFNFANTENIDVSRYTKASRSLLHAELTLPTGKLHIICVHLGLLKNERKVQFSQLISHIHKFVADKDPLIIAGDFNDWRYESEQTIEKELQLEEALQVATGNYGKTFPTYRPALAVDRIYFRGVTLKTAEVLTGRPWRYLSDHLPLLAEFEINHD